jgi:uncharacterized protein (DUF427 family)
MRMQAIFNGTVIADSDKTVVVEGNHYFPISSARQDLLTPTDTHTVCPWKGTASYYTVTAGDQTAPDAAWYYPTPSDAAKQITGHVAFWRGVKVVPADDGATQ